MDALPGDIFCSAPRFSGAGGEQALSEAIIEACQDDPYPTPSHTFVAVDAGTIVEATWPEVKTTPLAFYTQGNWKLWQMRWQSLSDAQRLAIVQAALSKVGQPYGVVGLEWDGLDRLFHTRAVSQALGFDKILVCSGLAAWASKEGAGRGVRDDQTGNLLRPESVTPDDFVDAARKWPADLQPVWDNLTADDYAAAEATWEKKLAYARQAAQIATAGWPTPGT